MDTLKRWVVVGAVVVSAAGLAIWWLRRSAAESSRRFFAEVIGQTADWLATHRPNGQTREALTRSLHDAISGTTPAGPKGLHRAELQLVRKGANAIEVGVLLLTDGDGGPGVVTLTRTASWSELPGRYREDFIHSNDPERRYVLWEGAN